jgi:hypothetical protein
MSKNLKKIFQKASIFLLLFSLFFSCFAFRDQFLTQIAQLAINWVVAPDSFIKFKAKKMHFGLDGACFEGVELSDQDSRFSLQLHRAKICLTKSRNKISICVNEANLFVDETKLTFTPDLTSSVFDYCSLDVKRFFLKFAGGAQKMELSLKGDEDRFVVQSKSQKKDCLNFYLSMSDKKEALLEIKDFSAVKISPLLPILSPSFSYLELQKASVSAKLLSSFQDGKCTIKKAEARVKDCLLKDVRRDVELRCEDLELQYEKQFDQFDLVSSVSGASILFNSALNEANLEMKELCGKLLYDSKDNRHFELSGKLHCQEQEQSILIQGEPKFSPDNLSCTINLALEGQEKYSGLSIHFGLKEDHRGFVSLNFQNIDARNAFGAKRFFGSTLRSLQDYSCTKGMISGAIDLNFLRGKLIALELKRVQAKDLVINGPQSEYSVQVSDLDLDLTFDPQKEGLKKIDKLHVITSSASLCLPVFGVDRNFENVNMQLVMNCGLFESSFVKCMHEGVSSQLVFLGDRENLELEGYFRSSLAEMATLFGQKECALTDTSSCLSLHVKKQAQSLNFSSSLILDENEEQRLDIKGASNQFTKFDLGLIHQFEMHSKALSQPLVDAVMQRLDPKLNLQGSFNVDLNYENKIYVLDLIANDIRAKRGNRSFYSHTNVSGDRALEAHLVFDESFAVEEGRCVFDNFFVKDEDSQLEFRQINTTGSIKKNCFNIEKFSFDSHGIYFSGAGMLRKASNGLFAKLYCSESIGSIAQINALLSHIEPLKGVEIPCTGQVKGGEGGLELNFAYQDYLSVDYKLDLLCQHGSMTLNEMHSLKDMNFRFRYDSKDGAFRIGQASANVKAASLDSGYTIRGDGVYWPQGYLDANLQGVKGDHEICDFRVLYKPQEKSLFFKPNSHFLNISMNQSLISRDKIRLECPLSNYELKELICIARDLDLLTDELSQAGQMHLSDLKFRADLSLEGSFDAFRAALKCSELQKSNEAQGPFELLVDKDMGRVLRAKFRCANVKAHANIKINPSSFEVEKASYSDEYCSVEIDQGLFDLNTWILNFNHYLKFEKEVRVNAYGSSTIDFNKSQCHCHSSSKIELFLKEHKVHLQSQKSVNWSLDSNLGLNFKEFAPTLTLDNRELELTIKNFEARLLKDRFLHVKGQISDKPGLQGLTKYLGLESFYGDLFDPVLSTTFNLKFKDTGYSCVLDLPKCRAREGLVDLELNKTRVVLSNKQVRLTSQCYFMNDTLDLSVNLINQRSLSAKLFKDGHEVGLVEGYLSPQRGPVLTQCLVNHFGLSLNLAEQAGHDTKSVRYFVQANLSLIELKNAINSELLAFIDHLELDKGLSLSGSIVIFPDDFRRSYFEGQIKGKRCDALGYLMDSVFSTLFVDQKTVILQDLSCADAGVCLSIPEISISSDKKGRHIRIPEFRIKNLRPSSLKKGDDKKSKSEPFLVNELLIKDIHGSLENIETLKGRGHLVFENHAPRDHHIAKLPMEFISSLGLDRALLVPVQGTMECDLKGLSLVFTSLKDSYSQGRRSLFFLCNKEPSYIDLKGNIHMNIKMKQNVLFKFTELFILSIRGTLDEPDFSLQ